MRQRLDERGTRGLEAELWLESFVAGKSISCTGLGSAWSAKVRTRDRSVYCAILLTVTLVLEGFHCLTSFFAFVTSAGFNCLERISL